MVTAPQRSYIYVGLAGEGDYIGAGGLFRRAAEGGPWEDISRGLPEQPQIRALALHPQNPAMIYAGTQQGVYRSADRGGHWESLGAPEKGGANVWSLLFHPKTPDVIYAGYEPCAVYRSEDGGRHWQATDTSRVTFPHITTYMPPLGKRVIGMAADPANPNDIYGAIEVGGLIASRDGGDTWQQLMDGPYVRNNTLDLHEVQVSAAAPGTVFIATQVAMFRGLNGGCRWEHLRGFGEMFPGGSYCRDLLVAPGDPRTLWLCAGAGGGGAPAGTKEAGALFRSRDLGETWERLDLGEVPPRRLMQVAIDAKSPNFVVTADYDGRVYASADGGKSWRKDHIATEFSRARHVYPMVCG